jgi:tRNA(Ile)-lysidine synthetase-like protein
MARLAARGDPWSLALPHGVEARAAYGELTVARRSEPTPALAPVAVTGPGAYPLPGRGVLEVRCDGAPPRWPLVARSRRPGDRFSPRGGAGGKKLKRWLIDAKVPRAARDGLVLLEDADGRIVYVVDLGAAGEGAGGLAAVVRAAE